MSHVDSKKCRMSLSLIFLNVRCRIEEKTMSHDTMIFSPCSMSLSLMSHVESKKCHCRRVDFRGLEPCDWSAVCRDS